MLHFLIELGDETRATNKRIADFLKEYKNSFQLTYKISTSAKESTGLEKELLLEYLKIHKELPPFNRNISKK